MKVRLDDEAIAMRVSKEFMDGSVVNLGFGLPTLCSMHIPEDKRIIFHTENGALGFGSVLSTEEKDQWDFRLINASAQFVAQLPGMSFFDQITSFGIVRGGHIDVWVAGALQVSETGDLANWLVPGRASGGMGGAMDLAIGAKKVIVAMAHSTKEGEPKILKRCTYPITAPKCVSLIVTDISVIEVTNQGLLLKEIAPGWTTDEVQVLTETKLSISKNLKEITL